MSTDAPGVVGLSRTADGHVVPLAAERARPRLAATEDPVVGWSSAIGLALLALFFRLWQLGEPRRFLFDETYYAKDAWSLLHFGYAREYADDVDERIVGGDLTGLWTDQPSMAVHPEVGKWLIAAGEQLFGMNAFGWRVSAAVVGSLMVLVMCRFVRRLTGSTLLGLVAGVLLSLDGLHLVLSRLALLDIFVAFFVLLGTHLLVMDRDWFRRRLATSYSTDAGGEPGEWGPLVLWRPWLLVAGVVWGLAVGTKWVALYPLAAFGLCVWLWSGGARRSFGARWEILRSAVTDGLIAFVSLIGVALVTYTLTWTGWLLNAGQFEAAYSNTQYTAYDGGQPWSSAGEPDASGLGEVAQSLRSLAHYHRDVFVFHVHFLDESDHTYESHPAGWLLLNRPVGANADTAIQPGERGCRAPEGSDCLRQVLLLGNPVIWWLSIPALLASVALWIGARDWRFGVAVIGICANWFQWFFNADRPIFIFYAITILPFVVLAQTLLIGKLLGPPGGPRRLAGVVAGGSFVVLALLAFAFFWPIWTNELLTHRDWLERMWLRRWI